MSVRCIVVNLELRGKRPKNPHLPKELNTVGDHIRKARIERNMSQPDVAEVIGVLPYTVTSWELGHSNVLARYMPKVITFLGYNPVIVNPTAIGERLKKWRLENGVSVKQLQSVLNIDRPTIQRVEAESNRVTMKTLKRVENFLKTT